MTREQIRADLRGLRIHMNYCAMIGQSESLDIAAEQYVALLLKLRETYR